MKGLIFSIKRYSVHDGPGIRVTFFMKGCPLSCWWCHNPEGISPEREPVIQIRRVGEKEFQVQETAGEYYSVDDILEIAEKESIFLQQSGGGVTFSGGEPMMQSGFLIEALKVLKANGFHTAIDTSGYSLSENFRAVIQFTDLFLFDLKHLNDAKHVEYTGVSNSLILENLKLIIHCGKDLMIRIPVIPGINDDIESVQNLKKFLNEIKCDNLLRINLLPFHRIGRSKYEKLNLSYRMRDTKPPSSGRMKELKDFFSETGIKVKIGG